MPSLWACDKEGDVCVKQKKEHKIKSIILFIFPPKPNSKRIFKY